MGKYNQSYSTFQDEDELRIMRDGKARIAKSNVILDSDDDDDVTAADADADAKKVDLKKDVKGEAKTVIKCPKKEAVDSSKPEMNFSDLVRGHNGDLLFIQLPDHLPGRLPVIKDEKPDVGNSQVSAPARCKLDDLSEGYFGSLFYFTSSWESH